mmetsp:Transcript_34252/g.97904  ORF Transcript_34252/g.97904 Transcript_34252/m.97904 type:complete len:742 (-) Transcript_34252:404-2629(-)
MPYLKQFQRIEEPDMQCLASNPGPWPDMGESDEDLTPNGITGEGRQEVGSLTPRLTTRGRRAAVLLMALPALAAAALALGAAGFHPGFWSRGMAKEDVAQASQLWQGNLYRAHGADATTTELLEGSCGKVEHGVEFHTLVSLRRVEHIYSMEMCCAACSGHPECGAWAWVQRRHARGLTDHCLLRKLGNGEVPQKVRRPGIVSGVLKRREPKHGLALLVAREVETDPPIMHNETCSGEVSVMGHGTLSVVNARFMTPGWPGSKAEVPSGRWAVSPHLRSRSYLAEKCIAGKYNRLDFAGLRLLGRTLKYTTDLSKVGCGCNAQLHLLPMKRNLKASRCGDYFCGPAQAVDGLCGVSCNSIRVQDANALAWSSGLHLDDDAQGLHQGYGGGLRLVGLRSWKSGKYGPNATCVDTDWPFEVAMSFPVDAMGELKAVEVTLSQSGGCELKVKFDHYGFQGRNGMRELSQMLDNGVTPTFSYWSSKDLRWLDGLGMDGQGPCIEDTPKSCPNTMRFYDFRIIEHDQTTGKATRMDEAMSVMDSHVAHEAFKRRQEELARAAAKRGPPQPDASMRRETEAPDAEVKWINSEWEVIIDKLLIRQRPNFFGRILGRRSKGEMVFGRRVGKWIQLLHEPGWMAIEEGQPFLKERTVSYKRLHRGFCEDAGMFPVEDVKTCQAAAFALGYFDTFLNTYKDVSKRPYGCYILRGQLFMVTNKANKKNPPRGGRNLLCASQKYPTPTTTTVV